MIWAIIFIGVVIVGGLAIFVAVRRAYKRER